MKQLINQIRKQQAEELSTAYDGFRKDILRFPKCVSKMSEKQKAIINTLSYNKNNVPIFTIPDDDKNYDIKICPFPFKKFFISTNIVKEINKEPYSISGLFIIDINKTHLAVFYFWTRLINDGWMPGYCLISKDALFKNRTSEEILNAANVINNESGAESEEPEWILSEITKLALYKTVFLLQKLIYKVSKNEYKEYKEYSYGKYETKQIVNSNYVMSHKRHFWKDSGRFLIPTLSKEEILNRGYGIDNLVFRSGEWRTDVPYRIISDYKTGVPKNLPSTKTYNLFKKRILRSEETVYRILKEIYPDKIIRRHDRKTLKGLELDFNIPELRLGIEYDGEQHFDKELYKKLYGDGFDAQVRRDRQKDSLCRRKKITLIRIKYDEPLTKTHIKKRIVENNI